MSDRPPADVATSVVSLFERLPPARQARHLAVAALDQHGLPPELLAHFTRWAERLATNDPEEDLAYFLRVPGDHSQIAQAIAVTRAMIGVKRYLAGDHEGGFAAWEEAIAASGGQAGVIFDIRAMFRVMRGELDGALADLHRAVALAPTDAGVYSRRGDVLYRLDRRDEAAANYRRAAQLDPDYVNALAGLGRCLLMTRRPSEAVGWYDRALERAPASASLRAERALCFEETGRLDEAVADLDVAIAHAPDDAESYHARGRCRRDPSGPEAIADFTRAIELDPDDADYWMARSRAHLRRRDLDAAQADAERAVALNPSRARAHCALALVFHVRGDLRRALDGYEAASRLAPTELVYISARMMVLQHLGDRRGLRKVLDQVLTVEPVNPELRAAHARMLAAEGEHERALADFDTAIALGAGLPDADRAALHHDRAEALRDLGRHEEALADEEQAVALAPDVAAHHAWLGVLLTFTDGDAARAEAELTRAIELDPDDAELRLHRAMHHEHHERWAAALADHDKAVELAPKEGAFWFRRGAARWQSHETEVDQRAALADFDQALALIGDHADILCWRAFARMELDDHRGALADLDRAVAANPEHGEAFYLRNTCRRALGDEAGAREDLERSAELGWEEAREALAGAEVP